MSLQVAELAETVLRNLALVVESCPKSYFGINGSGVRGASYGRRTAEERRDCPRKRRASFHTTNITSLMPTSTNSGRRVIRSR